MQQLEKPKQGYRFAKWFFGKSIELPENWELSTLGKSCDQIQDMDHKMPTKQNSGIPFLSISHVVNKEEIDFSNQEYISKEDYAKFLKKMQPKKNDLLYSRVGTIGEARIIREDKKFAFTYNVVLIKTNEKLNSHFLKYMLNFDLIKNRAKSLAPLGVYSFLGLGDIKKIPILLPTLQEQQKIALILSNVDSLIQQTQETIEQTQRLKKGLMQRLLTKGIGHTKFRKTKVGEIPEGWSILKANEICNEIVVGIVIKPASLYSKDGVSCLRSFNIKEEKIYDKDIVKISHKANEINSKSKLRKGDVLIVRTGYPGTACVVPQEYVGGNCIDLVIARPKESLRSKFLSIFINSSVGKEQVLKTQGGLAQQHFNVSEMKNMLIPLPSLQEQDEIVLILSNVDSQIQKHQHYKSKLETLKKGLMQKLLTGQIRVKV